MSEQKRSHRAVYCIPILIGLALLGYGLSEIADVLASQRDIAEQANLCNSVAARGFDCDELSLRQDFERVRVPLHRLAIWIAAIIAGGFMVLASWTALRKRAPKSDLT